VQRVAFHARHEFDHAVVADVLDQAVDDRVAQLTVGHLTALEAQRRFHLVAVLEEADGLVPARHVVMVVDGDRELDFLDRDDLLALARRAVALFLLVEELPVVLDAADGRNGGGRDFDEIQAALARDFQGLEGRQNAELLPFFVDYADLAGADPVVDANKLFRGTFVDGLFSSGVARPRGNSV
jgi:hypothetical protein